MKRVLAAVVLIGIMAPAAHAAPVRMEHSTKAHGEHPMRETALLKALPLKATVKAENKAAWLHRIHERREARREARQAAREAIQQAAPVSAPVVASGGWADELRAVGFPESAIATMLYIIGRESGGDPSAVNTSSGACGLVQLYPCPPGGLDPMTNLTLGYAKYQASGFAPWGM